MDDINDLTFPYYTVIDKNCFNKIAVTPNFKH